MTTLFYVFAVAAPPQRAAAEVGPCTLVQTPFTRPGFGDSNCAEYNQTAGNDVAITYRDSVREFYPHSGLVGVGRRIAFEQPQIPKTPLTGATRWKPKTADKLNLLMIISDQHRWD